MIIDFEITQGGHTFCDALILDDDHTFTAEQIEQMKQDRFDNWLLVINSQEFVSNLAEG
jgi:hypothetical protein